MDDNNFQNSYHGLSSHNFAPRSMSMTERTGQQSLDAMAAMHYQTPMSMWHHPPPQPSNVAAMSIMSQAQNQQHNPAALSLMLQSQGLRHYYGPVKMFPPAMQQTQNPQFYHATVACSKRFSEEEKQKLEKVFTDETQKPSTSRKRQLAEELGCPVPKVNNWFQNRRAREKQLHRVQAYEASQAADLAAVENECAEDQEDEEDDDDDSGSGELDSTSNRSLALKPSSAPFPDTDDSSEQEDAFQDSSNGREGDASAASDSPAVSPLGASSGLFENDLAGQAPNTEHQAIPQSHLLRVDVSMSCTPFDVHQGILSSSPETYPNSEHGTPLDMLHDQLAPEFSLSEFSGLNTMTADVKHNDYFPTSASFMGQNTPSLATNMLRHDQAEVGSSRQPSEVSDFSCFDSLSPDMTPQTSPNLDHTDLTRDHSSSNASIASRRKTRPPQRLNQTALRNYTNGPKTGIEGPKQSELYRTMRRAASATGPLSGKILKSGPPVSPLSPRTFDPGFLEQIARSSSLTATTSAFKERSTGSNVEQRYLSADAAGLGIQRSSSLSVNNFGETLALSPCTSEYNREASFGNVQTPSFQHFQNPTFTLDTGCGNVSPNEALTTPGLSQFGSELEFPTSLSAPRYVESEPATPSYVPVTLPTTSTTHSQGFPTLKVETPPQGDIFPWSRSPDQLAIWNGALGHFGEPQSQTFQFQPNITPQNFNSPGQA